MKSSVYRLSALIAPLVCLAIAVGLGVSQYLRLKSIEQERVQTEGTISFVRQLIADLNAQPIVSKVAAVANTPDEQNLFLDQLRLYAAEAGVDVTRWQTVAAPREQVTSATPTTPNPAAATTVPQGPPPLLANVEVVGNYDKNRKFLYLLMRAERLMNLSNIKWERAESPRLPQGTRVSFTLTRYVSDKESLNPAKGLSAEANNGQGTTQ